MLCSICLKILHKKYYFSRDKRNKMDTSCCCYAKVLDDISKLKESQNNILEGVEKLIFAFNNRETFHDEERPKKKRRHFSNRCPESSLKGNRVVLIFTIMSF